MSKFHNQRTRDAESGRWFASRAEYGRYQQLKLLERAGEIRDLECQPRFRLLDPARDLRAVDYYGDFRYWERGEEIVEDVKGVETAVFKLKWNLVQRRYPWIDFRIIPAEDCYG